MPAFKHISAAELGRLIGTPDCPALIDVRLTEDRAQDPRILPASVIRPFDGVDDWAGEFVGRKAVIICQRGLKLSQGVAAWLRHAGIDAETLEGGFEAWRDKDGMLVRTDHLPALGLGKPTLWVTRARPKIDRIACPWLIRRFIDPDAVFLFVSPGEVEGVAARFGAIPLDIENVFWTHVGERATFDRMVEEFGLSGPAMARLATIIRGADTHRHDLAPEAPGLLAISLGLSRMFRDDLAQLDAGMLIYDALYRWCRDATGEQHTWVGKSDQD